MMETLTRLMKFHGAEAKSVVWAHNTHIGDASATEMKRSGMLNLGQLAREHAGQAGVVLVGFGTYRGSVIAAKEWGERMEVMPVPRAIDGSWDEYFHRKYDSSKLAILDRADAIPYMVKGQRAIGVVYNPSYERLGNYVETVLPERYDAFLFIDDTHALRPLHMAESPDAELPETFPTGF
jgi:erythromycin esterase